MAKIVADALHNRRIIARHFGEGGTLLDVGANIGEVAIGSADQFDRVVAVEAHPRTFDFLARRIRRAGLSRKIKTINAVVASRTGETYYVSTPSRLGIFTTARPRKFHKDLRNYYHEVETISLRDVIRETRARAVKIDIEGGEYECLDGFVFPRFVDRLCVEFHWCYKNEAAIKRIVRAIDATGLRFLDRGSLRKIARYSDDGCWRAWITFVFVRRR